MIKQTIILLATGISAVIPPEYIGQKLIESGIGIFWKKLKSRLEGENNAVGAGLYDAIEHSVEAYAHTHNKDAIAICCEKLYFEWMQNNSLKDDSIKKALSKLSAEPIGEVQVETWKSFLDREIVKNDGLRNWIDHKNIENINPKLDYIIQKLDRVPESLEECEISEKYIFDNEQYNMYVKSMHAAYSESVMGERFELNKIYRDLRVIGHYYNVYKNVDSINLNLFIELLKDSFAYIVEQDNGKNESGDTLFKNNLYGSTDKHRKIITDELSSIEEKTIQELKKENVKDTFDALHNSKRKNEIRTIVESVEKVKKDISQYIYEKYLLISMLCNAEMDKNVMNEIIEIYNELLTLSIKYNVSYNIIFEYAVFLCKYKYYREGLYCLKELWKIEENSKLCGEYEKGTTWSLFGLLYWQNQQYYKSQKAYKKSLIYLKNTANCDYHKIYYLYCYNNYALLLDDMNLKKEAIKIYQKIYGQFEEQITIGKQYEKVYMTIIHNYACLLIECNRAIEAKDLLEKVLMFVSTCDDKELKAIVYNSISVLYKNLNNKEKALIYFQKAIQFGKELCDTNFYSNAENLAIVYNNYAVCILNVDFDEAKRYFQKSIHLFEVLSYDFYDNCDEKIAKELFIYANSLQIYGEKAAVIDIYKRILSIYSNLIEKEDGIYKIKYAKVCTCLAVLFDELNDCFKAKKFYFKAYEMYNRLSDKELKTCEIDYAILCMAMGMFMFENDANPLAVKKIFKDAQKIFVNYTDYTEYIVLIKKVLRYFY